MPVNKTADEKLVALARSGNRDAFAHLIERYQIVAKSVAMRMVSNEDIARELVQESILQALLSLDHLRDEERFKSWFYGIVINVCRTYWRKHKVNVVSFENLAVNDMRPDILRINTTFQDPQDVVEERELHHLVLTAIEGLSPGNREAVRLFYYRHLSLQETAALLDVSVEAVKVRLHRARKQLREQLLQMYPEIDLFISAEQRRNTMIRVTITDVVRLGQDHIVVLFDAAGGRLLPIWIGDCEAIFIAMGQRGFATPRPLTFNFVASLMESLEVELEEARIEALKEDTFYGVAKLRCCDQVQEVDARPSDILALAVQTDSPIYVGEEVMEKAGIDIRVDNGITLRSGRGIDALLKELEETWHEAQAKVKSEEDRERCRRELLEYVLGDSE